MTGATEDAPGGLSRARLAGRGGARKTERPRALDCQRYFCPGFSGRDARGG